ncbi:hypothetical protein PV326_004578 [Microctonus aethiopoides]|nr:hypothetical protein PV326_004578 [Microctonus aethiopoides]
MQNFDDLDIEGRHPSHLSEEEREKEDNDRKRLMRCSVTAEDGTLRPVYSRTDDGDIWCHICNIALFGAHKLQNHNTSSRHKIKLDEWPYPVSLWSKRDAIKSSNQGPIPIPDTLAPGEPVPPGMEDQMTRSTTIQVSLDRHQSSPLVGLEYLLELVDNDSCEPSYTCVLCDKRGDPRTVMAHITSYNHRITYLNRHFPTISRAITELPRTHNYKRGANEISVLVAKKIEEKFGRLHPQLVDKSQFEKNKIQYIKNVYQDYHFRETPELTFMEVYDVRWVTHFDEKMAEMNIDMKKGESMKIRILTKDKLQRKSEKDDKKTRPSDDTKSLSSLSSISSSPSPDRSRSRSRSRTRRVSTRELTTKYRHSKSYRHGRSRSRSRSTEQLRERDKWDKFREQIRRAEETLDRALKFHEKNPEKHPSYPDEWKKFWNRRYKELQAEGKDPSKHDFKPEWIEFWNKRMREMHNEQLAARKEEIRKRLELPEDKPPENPKWTSSSRNEKRIDKEDRHQSPKRSRHHIDSDDDVEYVGTKTIKPERLTRERDEYRERHERERDIERERDLAYAYSREKASSYRNYYPPPIIPRTAVPRSRHYSTYASMKEKSMSPTPKEDSLKEDLEIVGLLRLLTALEGQLGSLGPKIVTLLSRALAAEKAKPNSAEELLYDEEVSVLFETVKEKLKGQLFANMIEKMAIAATKSAIQNIAQLLHRAAEEKRKKEEEEEKRKKQALEMARSIASFSTRSLFSRTIDIPSMKSEPVSVPGVGSVDKVAIAQQIAAALIAQGRTNVSQDELETLINAVVGMAEASQRSDKPVTAANFVKSLTAANSQSIVSETVTPVTAPPLAPASAPPQIAPPPLVVTSVMPEKLHEPSPPPPPVHALIKNPIDSIEAHAKRMENLTDGDLKNLLQNFKELGTDEQHGLINFLKKLEASDPGRVEKLRAFVNLGSNTMQYNKPETPPSYNDIEEITIRQDRNVSPFSARKGGHNPIDDADHIKWKPKLDMFADDEEEEQKTKKKKDDDKTKGKLELSDDDDDYTFEDIYKAADKNVSENEKARKKTNSRSNSASRSWSQSRSRSRSPLSKKESSNANNGDPTAILNETKRLIANIMGDLPNKYVVKSHINPDNDKTNSSMTSDVMPPGSTPVSIPTLGYPHNYQQQSQQLQSQQQQQQQQQHHQHQHLSYGNTMPPNQFTNYQQPPQQSFNNSGYMNNMPTNMVSPMNNMNNGYNYNQQSVTSYGAINQGQYGAPPPQSLQTNQYPQHLYGAPSQYNTTSSNAPPIGYPPQNQYGNYSQQQRFY